MIRPVIRRPRLGAFREYERGLIQRSETAALIATDRAAFGGKNGVRRQMSGGGLGRLGFAVDAGSDMRKSGRVHRIGANGFRTSGWINLRTKSERTLGAITAYTEGADILPRKGKGWLWIATDEIPARAGRARMTPERYVARGFDRKIGPLTYIRSVNGNPLLVVTGASVNAGGKPHSAKALGKNGRLRKGQREKQFIVCFIGIPRTSRAARVDAPAEFRREQASLKSYWYNAMEGTRG